MLEIHEVLDRLEILNPTDTYFSDLRKTIIDKDQFAFFRIIQNKTNSQLIEGLRKLKDDETFCKDAFSRGQLRSKIWLITELNSLSVDLGTVFLCAGWYATLATMLFESDIKVDKVRSFDIDPSTVNVAEVFNKPWFTKQWKFKALVEDIFNIDYNEHTWQHWSNTNNRMSYPITDIPNTIINTSCEHIENFSNWYDKIPNGKLIILQSNNYFEVDEHVNCSNNLSEFSNSAPMSEILYEGELDLDMYKRFMKIGYK
jgi:hypothetical protein